MIPVPVEVGKNIKNAAALTHDFFCLLRSDGYFVHFYYIVRLYLKEIFCIL